MGLFDRIKRTVTGGSDDDSSSSSSSGGGRSIAERTRDAGNTTTSGRDSSSSSSESGSDDSSSDSSSTSGDGRSIAERTRDAGNTPTSGRDSSYSGSDGGRSIAERTRDAGNTTTSGRDASSSSSDGRFGDAIASGIGSENSNQQPTGRRQNDFVGQSTQPGVGNRDQIQTRNQQQETNEQFGDADLSLGFGGPEDEVEQAADAFQRNVARGSENLGDRLFDGGASPVTASLNAAGREEAAETYDQGVRNFGSGIVQGAGNLIGGVPKLAVEGTETAVFAAQKPVQTAEQTPGAVASRASALAGEAQRNPAEFAGSFVGSAALSGGLFKATQGTRVGTATRTALQPGEEAVKAGINRGLLGDRAARLTPGVSTDQISSSSTSSSPSTSAGNSLGSGGSGSLFNADALDQAQGVSGPSRAAQLRGRISRSDTLDRIRDATTGSDRAQAQLTGRQRSRATEPEISDDRVTPNLYQQSVDNQLRRQRDALEGGTFEGEQTPFGASQRRAQAESDFETLNRRRNRQQERTADGDGNTRSIFDTRLSTGIGAGASVGAGVGIGVGVGVGAGPDTATGPRTQPDVDIDIEPDTPVDSETNTGQETRSSRDSEFESAFELEQEAGREFESAFESVGREGSGSRDIRLDGESITGGLGLGGGERRFEFETRDLL